MTTNNQLLNIKLLKTFLNKTLKRIHHDTKISDKLSYGAIYFEFDDSIYQLTDFYEGINYFGIIEDISVLRISSFDEEIKSYIDGSNIFSTEINKIIKRITLVNVIETISSISDTDDCDTLLDTLGIILTFDDDYQFAFEKDDFGENISIYKGYNLEDEFKNIPNEFEDGIVDGFLGKCILEYIDL